MRGLKLFIVILILSTGFGVSLEAKKLINELKPRESLNLKWKKKVGLTTYRTTIQNVGKYVFVPSNGKDSKGQIDFLDGVHVLDGKTGALVSQLVVGKFGDRDVNGVAVSSTKIVFGTDENYLAAYDWNFKILWVVKAGGDFEGSPVLLSLNSEDELDVVAATEAGEIIAVDGKTGDIIWSFQATANEFNRQSQQVGFLASPLCVDVNGDGVRDVIVAGRNGVVYALNGKNGQELWKYSSWHPSGFLASPVAKDSTLYLLESHGYLHQLSKKGRLIQRIPLYVEEIPTFVASPVLNQKNEGILIGSTFGGAKRGIVNYQNSKKFSLYNVGKVSATTIIANINEDPGLEQLIVTEKNELLVFNSNDIAIARYKLPAGAEASPLIADVDGDGLLELLIALKDQMLYCYELKSSGPVYWPSFRANPYNTGVLFDSLDEDYSDNTKRLNAKNFEKNKRLSGFNYNTWYSANTDSTLITEEGIGKAKLGLSLGQFKALHQQEISLQEFHLEEGVNLMGVIENSMVQYYLGFANQGPINDGSIIKRVITNNPKYVTKEGLRPGQTIQELEKKLGAATLYLDSLNPTIENLRFANQEQWLTFNNYSSIKAGLYPEKGQMKQTQSYNPSAIVQFIGVRKIKTVSNQNER
jgi:outer membrane protein assembly factor BamB